MPFHHCTASQQPTVVQQGKSVRQACQCLRPGGRWVGISDQECRPNGAGLLPGGRVPSDPRGPGLARISSFHGEGSQQGRGEGRTCRPQGLRLGRRRWKCGGGGSPRLVPDALTISLHCFSEHSSATSSEHLRPAGGDPPQQYT